MPSAPPFEAIQRAFIDGQTSGRATPTDPFYVGVSPGAGGGSPFAFLGAAFRLVTGNLDRIVGCFEGAIAGGSTGTVAGGWAGTFVGNPAAGAALGAVVVGGAGCAMGAAAPPGSMRW